MISLNDGLTCRFVVIIAGTNGEAVVLTKEEKTKLVQNTRKIAQRLGRSDVTVTMGCGGQSTREVIAETILAKDAGAEFALVLVPSYYHFAMSEDAIVAFFEELASASPIPVLIYNFPTVVAGLDLNSDMLIKLGRHPNIVGVKLTCAGIAKVSKIAAEHEASVFSAVAGQSDWLIPALTVGGTGAVTGVGNLYPKVGRVAQSLFNISRLSLHDVQFCVQMYDLYKTGKFAEAVEMQKRLAKMEWGFAKTGINGVKWVVGELLGYPQEKRHCRRPYPQFTDTTKQAWVLETVKPLLAEEKQMNSSPLLQ